MEGEAEAEITHKLNKGLDSSVWLLSKAWAYSSTFGLQPPEGSLKGLDGVLVGLRNHDLLLQLLQARSQLTPVLMVLEDLHWTDERL